jgi:hypothetical protein
MINWHAVMIDETGCEFGVSFAAATRAAALEYLRENYPESRCDQLEDPQQTADREQEIYRRAMADEDGWDDYDEDEDEDQQQAEAVDHAVDFQYHRIGYD